MIAVRRAKPTDAVAIGAVHVAAWRSAYPGILPDKFLSRLSVPRQAAYYDSAIRAGVGVHVATASGADLGGTDKGGTRIIGFVSGAPARAKGPAPLADGEIETLYVLDDFRDAGVGSALLRASGQFLASRACDAAYLWVLRDNPAHFFYERLGGKLAAASTTLVGGKAIPQMAYAWNPIAKLIEQESGVKG